MRPAHPALDPGLETPAAEPILLPGQFLLPVPASHLVMRGASLKAVQELPGHEPIEMTLRYSHLTPDVKREAVQLLDRTERLVDM